MPCRRACLAAALLAALPACVATEATPAPRPPLPLPAELAARFAIPGPVQVEALVPAGTSRTLQAWRGALRAGDERVTFHLLAPTGVTQPPLALCLPILAGGKELMWHVAAGLARRGFAALWADRVGAAMVAGQRSADLDALFTRTLVQNRILLAWARTQPHRFAPGQRGLVGISTGGILGGILLALEPDLAGGALCLAGGDLPRLLLASAEPRVVAWRAWRRRTDGLDGAMLGAELARDLRTDPLAMAPFVATERVLLVQARQDAVVPVPFQDLLWDRLGRPRRLRLPFLGHYPAALALDAILDEIGGFLRARMRQATR